MSDREWVVSITRASNSSGTTNVTLPAELARVCRERDLNAGRWRVVDEGFLLIPYKGKKVGKGRPEAPPISLPDGWAGIKWIP